MIPQVNEYFELIVNHNDYKEGDIVYIKTEQKYRYLHNGVWEEYKTEGGLNLGLYDLNKSIISQMKPLTQDWIAAKILKLNAFATKHNNMTYMLYGKEISYFTLFCFADSIFPAEDTFGNTVIDCLKSVGIIYSIETTDDETGVEIWLKVNDDMTCLYLFPYDNGIVGVRR